MPLQRDYYDVAGTLWKTEHFEVSTIDGVPTPIRIQMQDLLAKSTTEFEISTVRYGVEIPDALFDSQKLAAAADSPVWQAAGPQAATGR